MTDLPKTSAPANRAMAEMDINNLEQLTKYSEKELLQLHGMGPKAIRILKAELQTRNLSFKQNS